MIRKYLKQNKILLDNNGTPSSNLVGRRQDQKGHLIGNLPEVGSHSQISLWLDKSTGDVMSQEKRPQNIEEPGSVRHIYEWLNKTGEVQFIDGRFS